MKWPSFLKLEFSYLFKSKLALIGYMFGLILNLVVYYLTAKAFIPSPSLNLSNSYLAHGYFEYIVIGELCLLLPHIAVADGQESFFRLKDNGVLEQLYFSKTGLMKSLLYVYSVHVFLKMIFILTSLTLSSLFFGLSFNALMFSRFLLIQCVSVLFFLGLYFLNLSVSFIVGRRNSSFHHIINLLSFFSGAYFPIEIFQNESLKKILMISPFALQVQLSRAFVYEGILKSDLLGGLILWFIVPLAGAVLLYKMFANRLKGRFL